MDDLDTPPSSIVLLMDALAFPLRKWAWWLLVAACGVGIFWITFLMLEAGPRAKRLLIVIAALCAVIIRCYFSAMENTITGYGERPGEGSGPRMDDFWETLGRVVLVAVMSWSPAAIVSLLLSAQEIPLQPWVNILTALGCVYFPMALLGIVNFGGIHAAMPKYVIPAIFRCGPLYSFAAMGLLIVPFSALWAYSALQRGGFWPPVAASAVASYFLVTHARLVGRIYLSNRERLGWE
jgi:hypothetical protein